MTRENGCKRRERLKMMQMGDDERMTIKGDEDEEDKGMRRE